jgi:hypothetical protein
MTPLSQLCEAIQKRAESEKLAFFTDASGKTYVRNKDSYQIYLYWCEQVNQLRG